MTNPAFIFAYACPQPETAKIIEAPLSEPLTEGFVWYHLNTASEQTAPFLKDHQGLSPLICNSLMSEDTRPSIKTYKEGTLITLRCMNFNPGSDPEDMVALHLWVSSHTLITIRHEKIFAIDEMISDLKNLGQITSVSEFLTTLIKKIHQKIERIVYTIEDQVDELEESLMFKELQNIPKKLAMLRRKIIEIRRYIIPQREVLADLQNLKTLQLDDLSRWHFRDSYEKLVRIIEDLDLIRDRAALIHEEVNNQRAENMNKTMFTLSIVATLFLPLSFLTGLMGINVGGMPGIDSPSAFYMVCLICIIIFIIEYIFFKKRNVL